MTMTEQESAIKAARYHLHGVHASDEDVLPYCSAEKPCGPCWQLAALISAQRREAVEAAPPRNGQCPACGWQSPPREVNP